MRRALVLSVLVALPLAAVGAAPPRLEIADLARDFRWIARGVNIASWSDDGKTLYFTMQGKTRTDVSELYAVDRAGGEPRLIAQEDQWKMMPPAFNNFSRGWYDLDRLISPDRKFRLAVKDGDLYQIELATGKSQRLVHDTQGVSSPRYVLQGKGIAFRKGGNLYLLNTGDGSTTQVTDFRTGPKPPEPGFEPQPRTDQEKYLKAQQLELFAYLRYRKQLRDRDAELAKQRRTVLAAPEPFYVPDGQRVDAMWLSPDGSYVVFTLVTPPKDARNTVVPQFVTESGFTETPPSREKVGVPLDKWELGVYRTSDGKVTMPKLLQDNPEMLLEGLEPVWSHDGTRCLVPTVAMDYKTRWLLGLDATKGVLGVVHEFRDAAWVDGPAWDTAGWMPDDQRVFFVCEADGWAHLYTIQFDGRFRTQLTQGNWEVQDVRLAADGKSWLLVADKETPISSDVYRMALEGGPLTRLTGVVRGATQFLPSPDEQMLACLTSTPSTPFDVTLVPLDGSGAPRTVTHQMTDAYRNLAVQDPQVVQIPDGHGGIVYANLWAPKQPAAGRPAIVHVHGAGYAQEVYDHWLGTWVLEANYFAQRGYFYLDVDYLGSSGYGRACRTAVYRAMGGADSDSAVSAAQWLVMTHKVDPKRIGLYGRSYGGFLTEITLFKHPGVFAAGVAQVPVSDWAHYNHWYTARILNLPYTDDEAYRFSSPIYWADQLADRLLIVDGLVDSNVHAQDNWRLIQRLIEAHKTGWDMIFYPIEDHPIGEEDTRRDLFYRMTRLFDEVLKGEAQGARPAR